eukprot:TRINITY_DN2924_c0_g1_i1.p1 TRINITY_DN2924_c0_g1~~TRINITY_DN2924_c0_g1_i1.p1  ORF type:complete len:328 (-),score=35.02 TRINITY_DN2924_c0_g1_i1:205-1188(-)
METPFDTHVGHLADQNNNNQNLMVEIIRPRTKEGQWNEELFCATARLFSHQLFHGFPLHDPLDVPSEYHLFLRQCKTKKTPKKQTKQHGAKKPVFVTPLFDMWCLPEDHTPTHKLYVVKFCDKGSRKNAFPFEGVLCLPIEQFRLRLRTEQTPEASSSLVLMQQLHELLCHIKHNEAPLAIKQEIVEVGSPDAETSFHQDCLADSDMSSPPSSPVCLGKRERDDDLFPPLELSPHDPFEDSNIGLDLPSDLAFSSDTDGTPPLSPTLDLPIDGKRRKYSGTLLFEDLDLFLWEADLPSEDFESASVEPAPSPVTEFNASFQFEGISL